MNKLELLNRPLVKLAAIYAASAHAEVSQLRKYTCEPYIVHPVKVAHMVANVRGATPEMVAAAYLHDTVEDTKVNIQDIHLVFGIHVMSMVDRLTDLDMDGNRAQRKNAQCERLRMARPEVKTIKLADLIDNCHSICTHDPKFAKVFLPEMAALVDALEGGDRRLNNMAAAHCMNYALKLGIEI